MNVHRGHTLVELVVVLPLALLLAALVISTVIAQNRLTQRLARFAARAEAERTAAAVLAGELRWTAAEDVRTAGPDSMRLRVFRGWGVPCAPGSYTWHGMRAPAPAKDSVLVVSAGGELVLPLTGAAPDAPCGGYQLETPNPLPPGVVLVFETGTYYLRDRALRYRIGAEGRQPLTDEWLDDRGSAFRRAPDGVLTGVDLALRDASGGPAIEQRRIWWTQPNTALPQVP